MHVAIALLITFLASASAFPTDGSSDGMRTCFTTLKNNLENDSEFQTQVQTLVSNGQFSVAKDQVLDKIHELCLDQYDAISAFVQQHNKSIEILENMYNDLNETEKENVKKWQESKDYKSLRQFFVEKFKTLSPEDQQTLQTTFAALLKPVMQQNAPIIEKFLKACTPEEKADIKQYFTNGEFDKLEAFVKVKLDAGGFTDQEKQQINGFLDMLNKAQQGTA